MKNGRTCRIRLSAMTAALMLLCSCVLSGCTLLRKIIPEKETETEHVTETEVKTETETESVSETETETDSETEETTETGSETEQDSSSETETETVTETESETETETDTDTETEPVTETETEYPDLSEEQDRALQALLSELTEEYGLISTEPYSCPASIELLVYDPIPKEEMDGLFIADRANFDDDLVKEVLTLRLTQQPSADGTLDHLILEIYEFNPETGEYYYSAGRSFSVMNFSGTGFYCSFSLFCYETADQKTRIGLEFYGCFDSEMTTVLSLEYNGHEILYQDGAAYFEWDGSDETRSVYYIPQNTVNGSYLEVDGDGFYDWELVANSKNMLDSRVLSQFVDGLSDFGLELLYLRSIYEDREKNWETRNVDFSMLTAQDCYRAKTGELRMLGSIVSYYTVGRQTLLRTDYTGLLRQ